ncbi:hypothetical protein O3P69_011542 [Scylla paramamosain]|uniref:Uncharacterized protein n=1 Tax=Scylla paramamosain TaxID=85552 RepID=A0AAW0T707_SCYPA
MVAERSTFLVQASPRALFPSTLKILGTTEKEIALRDTNLANFRTHPAQQWGFSPSGLAERWRLCGVFGALLEMLRQRSGRKLSTLFWQVDVAFKLPSGPLGVSGREAMPP